MKTPAEVVQAAFDAITLEDWGGLAGLCHPVSLRLFKEEMLDQFGEPADALVEMDLEDAADDIYGELIDPEECLAHELFNVTSLEQLREMDPARVFARWIQAKSHRQRLLFELPDESWRGAESAPSIRTAQVYSFVVLGWLNDDPDLAHVLYRNDRDIPGTAITGASQTKSDAEQEDELGRILCVRSFPVTALCRRQEDGSWRLIASSSLYLVPTMELIDAS